MSAKRIQRKRTKGWRMPEGTINVTRPCDWGNPFPVGAFVTLEYVDDYGGTRITPALAVELFRAYVTERGWVEQIRADLAGKDLMCWCALDAPCHADVLLEIANGGAS